MSAYMRRRGSDIIAIDHKNWINGYGLNKTKMVRLGTRIP